MKIEADAEQDAKNETHSMVADCVKTKSPIVEEETAKLSSATSEKEKAEAKKRLNILKTEQANIINSWQKVNNLIIKAKDDQNATIIEHQNSTLAYENRPDFPCQ